MNVYDTSGVRLFGAKYYGLTGTDPSGGVVVVGSAAAVWGHLWVRRFCDG